MWRNLLNLSLPTKTIISALAIIVSFVFTNGAQAGRPLIHDEKACKAVAEYYDKKWGGSGNYKTKGCYYYENGKYGGKAYYGTGGVLWTQNANTGDGRSRNGKRRFDKLCHYGGFFPHKNPVWMKVPAGAYYMWRPYSILEEYDIECDCGNYEDGNGNHKGEGCSQW